MIRHVLVLGFDCPACRKTFRLVEEAAREAGVEVPLERVGDPAQIAGYRVLSVPAVVVDGRVVHQGSVPGRKAMRAWLTS
jgi:predicted thioredoxin/glutaredoxin